jgi:hypothetical protein
MTLAQLLQSSVTRLLRVAAMVALLGLAVMCASLIWPRALPVIFAMSVGHGIGLVALGCYGLAILIDARRRDRGRGAASVPPGASDSNPQSAPPPA